MSESESLESDHSTKSKRTEKSKHSTKIVTLNEEPLFLTHLKHDGWAIVKGVTSKEFAHMTASKFWDWFENFETGIDRDDPSTWTSIAWPLNVHGIIQCYGIGHEQFVWDVRMKKAIIKVFAKIYNDDNLLVSFDGANCSKMSRVKTKSWAHVDQGHKKLGFRCCQGFLNLNKCGVNDGGLVVYEGSHLLHHRFWDKTKKTSTGDWYKFSPQELDMFETVPCIKKVKVCCEPGDLVLWDSRTIHWASAPEAYEGRDPKRTRMAVYVSYQPSKLASMKDIAKKREAFKQLRMTSHWAAENIKLCPKFPRTYGNDTCISKFPQNKEIPALTGRGMHLAGLVD